MSQSVVYLFVDTNLLIQCLPLEELDWSHWKAFDEVRLIVAGPVLREVDYSRRPPRRLRCHLPRRFPGGPWQGYSDFLLKMPQPSELGPFSYEVADTKLSRSPKPKHLIQMGVYADILTREQGAAPERMKYSLGNSRSDKARVDAHALAQLRLCDFRVLGGPGRLGANTNLH